MQHIGKHIAGKPSLKKDKATERGEMMQYFMQKLNRARLRDGLAALTMGRMGRLLVAIPTPDLYFLKSICDEADKRSGIDGFSKKFWWEISPKNHTPEAKAEQEKKSKLKFKK
ncbi:MAG: hypothetical protein KA066_01600 [Candidatus Pacebacteria bacterium]|nr:hypothetical protein [Candidatus Paceibacterota bacterium]